MLPSTASTVRLLFIASIISLINSLALAPATWQVLQIEQILVGDVADLGQTGNVRRRRTRAGAGQRIFRADTGIAGLTGLHGVGTVSYTHLTLPTNREV